MVDSTPTVHEGQREGHHHGERHGGRGRGEHHGPKTFRRGRAIAFLEMMNMKRATVKLMIRMDVRIVNGLLGRL